MSQWKNKGLSPPVRSRALVEISVSGRGSRAASTQNGLARGFGWFDLLRRAVPQPCLQLLFEPELPPSNSVWLQQFAGLDPGSQCSSRYPEECGNRMLIEFVFHGSFQVCCRPVVKRRCLYIPEFPTSQGTLPNSASKTSRSVSHPPGPADRRNRLKMT